MLGKIEASLNEKLTNVEWGEYKLGDLFSIKSSKKIFHASALKVIYDTQIPNSLPYVVRMTSNNGIRGYICENVKYSNKGNSLSFAQDTFTVFYQENDFFTGNKVKVLYPLFNQKTPNVMKCFVACFKKTLENYTWGTGSTVNSIKEFIVYLPTKDGKIDFDFMESIITELEAYQIAELEAYLTVTGLKYTELTAEEEKALENYNNITFKNFKLTNVFDVKNTGNILSRDIVENSGTTPYLCASAENNAVSTYISYNESLKNNGNCIFIGGKTFVVTYQEKDFFSNDSHNIALYLKNSDFRAKFTQLYLSTCIYKSLNRKYSWGDSISNKKAQKDYIALPVKNGKIDYNSMSVLISAIHKIIIRDVVTYSDRKINMYKSIVNKQNV